MKRGLAALLLLAVVASHTRKEQSAPVAQPQALYARGREAIHSEEYKSAEQIAAAGRAGFGAQPYWRELFALLEAESVVRDDPKRALSILDRTPATGAPLPAVRRLILRAMVSPTKENFLAADALAARVLPEARAEIAWRRILPICWPDGLEEAQRCAKQAIDAATAAKQPWIVVAAYTHLAHAESHSQPPRPADAIEHYRLAIKYGRTVQSKYKTRAMTNLGWLLSERGDLDEALANLRPALALLSADQDKAMQTYRHIALVNIADIYVKRLEFDTALPYARRALADAQKPHERANSYHQLGQIELELGHYEAAQKWTDQALAIRIATKDGNGELVDRFNQARILAATGNPARALEIIGRLIDSKSPEPDRPTLWRMQGIAGDIHAKLGHFPQAASMYEKALATGTAARGSGESALAFERNLLGFYDGYIDILLIQGRVPDALGVAERSRARVLRERVGLQANAGVDPVALARAKKATILCYWVGARRSLLWTITPDGIDVAKLASDDEIDRAADAYRAELQSPGHSLAASALGRKLYTMLVAPAKIPPSSRVIILPDAHLNALNFDTLIAPDPKPHYWIDDVTISYSPSLHQLASMPNWRDVRDPRVLLFGDVPAAGPQFPKLRLAGLEIAKVAEHFDPSRRVVLSGTAATPSSYAASHPERFQFIHFAAHATASTGAPLESCVILAPDASGVCLYGGDIVRVPLGAELVTISSCNSAGRRSFAGEGLVGLAWAFLRAGAHRVVAAQWEVNDSVAPKVMDAMYAGIANGVEPAEALRRAKLALLHSNSIHERPVYWGPFVLYGAR